MKLLVVGSVALDSIITPFGEATDALGGSAVYFSVAASLLTGVRVVGVVGDDYPMARLNEIGARGIDLTGVEKAAGESFRWKGKYAFDLASRETLETRLGVFANFRPRIPPAFAETPFVFLGNIHPDLQLGVLDQMRSPRLVACDTMNFWIESARDRFLEVLKRVDLLIVNDEDSEPFRWLVSLEDPDLSFAMVDPGLIIDSYRSGVLKDADTTVFLLVALKQPLEESTANLRSPIVIENGTQKGRQIILDDDTLSVRHPLFSRQTELVEG